MDEKEEINKLGKRIKHLRKKMDYTSYEDFAFDKGFPRAQYGRYETGTNIRYKSLLRLVKAFDMTLEEFFSEGF